jgi:hypothetical protein
MGRKRRTLPGSARADPRFCPGANLPAPGDTDSERFRLTPRTCPPSRWQADRAEIAAPLCPEGGPP